MCRPPTSRLPSVHARGAYNMAMAMSPAREFFHDPHMYTAASRSAAAWSPVAVRAWPSHMGEMAV
ncbi:hypothetical protein FKP32DRAFT_957439 [Trametes sanguinea]|nr:hypothetical protein FKP32DRAFT_957439 [Trametes sanguinea]